MTTRLQMTLLIGLLLGAGHAAGEDFPKPLEGQFAMIKYGKGYGCGLFAEMHKGTGWFISGSPPATEEACRQTCDAQLIKARIDYRGKGMTVTGTCFHGKKPLFTAPIAEAGQ